MEQQVLIPFRVNRAHHNLQFFVAHDRVAALRVQFGDQVAQCRDQRTGPLVTALRDLVAELYAQGRNTVMGDEELEIMVRTIDTERYEHLLFHKSH